MTSGAPPKARLKRLVGGLLAFALLVATPSRAEEARFDLSHLTALLAQESESSVEFSEERYLAFLTEPVVLEGRFTFEPPDRLERLVLRPKRERMVIDGRLLVIETNTKDPPVRLLLSDHPPLEAFVVALRALLAGDQDALRQVYEIVLEGTRAAWSLHLTPRAPELRAAVEAIEIRGSAGAIASIEVREAGGTRSVISLREKA